jgi:endonuclease/exonuclease/phosphatase family metal-dependent hydrolase
MVVDRLPPVATLRILTANLWAEHSSPEGLAAVLDGVAPDVLAVQELQRPNADVIDQAFPWHGLEAHDETLGNGVASQWPATITRLPLAYRSGWVLRLDPGSAPGLERPFELINVHLANPIRRPWTRSVRARRHQVAALLHHVEAENVARVAVGDFNASPAWPAYRRIAARLTDGAEAVGTAVRTWRFQGWTPPLLRIDHAFGEGVEFLATETIAIPGADHLGLVVTIDVAEDEGAGPSLPVSPTPS